MTEKFTSYYEWLAESNKLTLSQALVLSRIKQWGGGGCWESYTTLAKKLKLDRSTVIRAVLFLLDKGLIKIKKEGKRKKTLYFNFDNTYLPLFDSGRVPPKKKLVGAPCHHDRRTMPPYIYSIDNEEIEETIALSAELMKPPKAVTKKEFQNRRIEQISRLKDKP